MIRKKPNKPKKSNHLSISTYIANYCQLGLLLLAIFGYFYTVRPIYQNQKLNEENAVLVKENERLKKESDEVTIKIKNDYDAYEKQISELKRDYNNKIKEYEGIREEIQSIYKAQEEETEKVLADSREFHKKIVLQNLKREISDNVQDWNDIYFGVKTSNNFFDHIESIETREIDNYINEIFRNPIDGIYPVINNLINKYKYLSDEDSKYITESLVKIEAEIRNNKRSYEFSSEKITDIKIVSRTYLAQYLELEKKPLLLRDISKEYELSQAFINDIFSYTKVIDRKDKIISNIMLNALNYKSAF